ncbi:Gfo/Idh/MocA family oxidoreductase [Caldilinea sp.]|uniref:Gfo/Idh/MocA family protein n=1 Tax=Caldilinea sp. TaxID=2293560 RepID=UPI002C80CBC1|nr:Gfo/Idh/MocA family oxidoreductase [Caldilinea sp.]HRA68154.1 Gfo/Idh/MocA family oxidoreductase [Caldilinea sp.]
MAEAIKPIQIALVGAGLYAQNAHLPALLALREHFEIVAVYSRTRAAATSLARRIGDHVAIYTELPPLLARPEIEAVDIMLPIPIQADFVAAALQAGKHVISEKPIAPDSDAARRLLAQHERQPGNVWMVAENWRYEEAFERAAQFIADGVIGRPVIAQWSRFAALKPGNPYYGTEWRRSGFAGGLLLDGVVHLVAALRLVLGEIDSVVSRVDLVAPDLPPADTLAAVLSFAGGVTASLLVSYAVETPWGTPLTIVGAQGSLRVDRGLVEIARHGAQVERIECGKLHGVQRELAAFAAAIRHGSAHRNTPAAALRDLAVIEAMLAAAHLPGQKVNL